MDFLAANHVRIVGLCGHAHCAVIFAIAQLSCLSIYLLNLTGNYGRAGPVKHLNIRISLLEGRYLLEMTEIRFRTRFCPKTKSAFGIGENREPRQEYNIICIVF